MPDILDGLAVIVTGAGRGLGRSYAEHAAAAGASVIVNDIDADAAAAVVTAINDAGGRAHVDVHDIADPAQADALVDNCVDHFGSVYGMVNNAAIFHESRLWQSDPAQWRKVIDVNVLGTMHCTLSAVRAMAEAGRGGAIVTAGSLGATGEARAAAYSASKGAVTSFSYAAAVELEPLGIRVNTIWPSALTPMVREMIARTDRPEVQKDDKPGSRLTHPDTVAPLVTYLLSPLAEGIAGQVFHFNGKTLGVFVHVPIPISPSETRADGWDVAAIADAIDGPLAQHMQPYGPRGQLVTPRARP